MINSIPTLDQFQCHFMVIDLNAKGDVDRSKSNPGAGWTNAGTSYTHVNGTTEQIYLGTWTVSNQSCV